MKIEIEIEKALRLISYGKSEGNRDIIIRKLREDEKSLELIITIINDIIENKVEVLNFLAVESYENEMYDIIIPLLQEALKIEPFDKVTLINLSQILVEFGEYQLAYTYILKVEEQDYEVKVILEKILELIGSKEILNLEQNDVQFTGERIVVNRLVKENYSDILEEHMKRYELSCKYVKDKIVLDAACGAGYGSKMLINAGAALVCGVDISEESLISAKRDYGSPNLEFIQGDVNRLPFTDASFDIVVSYETIEHIEKGSNWIQESARLLKEGGIFLVSTPNRAVTNPGTFYYERPLNPHHQFEYTAIEFVGELIKKYDILELYGQTFIKDRDTNYTNIMRQLRKMNKQQDSNMDNKMDSKDHSLLPLGDIKDMQPMYIVAVCRKKL